MGPSLIYIFGIGFAAFFCLEIVRGSAEWDKTTRKNIFVKTDEELVSAGYSDTPVMCTTVSYQRPSENEATDNNKLHKTEIWDTCGQSCTNSSYSTQRQFQQIKVDVRHFGHEILFSGCTGGNHQKLCTGYHEQILHCEDGVCDNLNGIFNCTSDMVYYSKGRGHKAFWRCQNYTDLISCNLEDGSLSTMVSLQNLTDLVFDRMNIGIKNFELYVCKDGACAKILQPTECKRVCSGIEIKGNNIIVKNGDSVSTLNCTRAVNAETDVEIWPGGDFSQEKIENWPIFTTFCNSMKNGDVGGSQFLGKDCFDGYFLNSNYFNQSEAIDLEQLKNAISTCGAVSKNVPLEQDLIISKNIPLRATNDFCTKESIEETGDIDECRLITREFGNTGYDIKLPSRFPCHRKLDNSTEDVVAQLTWLEPYSWFVYRPRMGYHERNRLVEALNTLYTISMYMKSLLLNILPAFYLS